MNILVTDSWWKQYDAIKTNRLKIQFTTVKQSFEFGVFNTLATVHYKGYKLIGRTRGVHGPVRSGFNPKIQPNQKIIVLVNINRTEPRNGSNRTGFVRFRSVFSIQNQKNRSIFVAAVIYLNLGFVPMEKRDAVLHLWYIAI